MVTKFPVILFQHLVVMAVVFSALVGCDIKDKNRIIVTNIYPADDYTGDVMGIQLKELFVLGEEDSHDQAPMYSFVSHIITEKEGFIYVYDPVAVNLHIYYNNGTYYKSIGKKGSAPGEFISIDHLISQNSGKIVAFDLVQRRMTSWETEQFDYDTNELPISSIGSVIDAQGRLVVYNFSINNDNWYASPLFTVYNGDMSEKISTFGKYKEISQDTSLAMRHLMDKGTSLYRSSGEILFAPYGYEGKLFLYNLTDSGWSLASIVHGSEVEKIYEEVDLAIDRPGVMFRHRGNRYGLNLYSASSSLTELADGRTVHLSLKYSPDLRPQVRYELFNTDLMLKSSGLINIPDLESGTYISSLVDQDGRIYLVESGSQIRVFQISSIRQ